MPDDARDRVRRLLAVVASGQPLPGDVATWLSSGLSSWLADGCRRSLDLHLGIAGRGVRKPDTLENMRRRDAALRVAFEHAHDGQPRDRRWRAGALSHAIDKFERRTWPRVRDADEPPTRLTRLERALWLARKYNARPLPVTPDYLVTRVYGGDR